MRSKPKYWKLSLLFSLCLHISALFLVEKYIHFHVFHTPIRNQKKLVTVPLDQIVTYKFYKPKTQKSTPHYSPIQEPITTNAPNQEVSLVAKENSQAWLENLLDKKSVTDKLFSHLEELPSSDKRFSLSLVRQIQKPELYPLTQKPKKQTLTFAPNKVPFQKKTWSYIPKIPQKRELTSSKIKSYHLNDNPTFQEPLAFAPSSPDPEALAPSYYASLPMLPALTDLHTVSLEDAFDIEVNYYPQEDEFVFQITLIPKPDLTLPQIPKHVFFLVDTSNAIQRDRLKATQNSIYRSLSYLEEGDTFNIISYDSSMQRLSTRNLPVTRGEKHYAKDFLRNLKLGNLFSTGDPFKPLNSLLFEELPENEVANIILITNGDGISNQNKNPYFIHDWTSKNQGDFTLDILALDHDNNLSLLDAFATLNKGKLHLSHTKNSLKRKMQKTIRSLKKPIAKDLYLTIATKAKDHEVELYPSAQSLPIMYSDQPFVIWGKTKSLDQFTLFLQGKNKSTWLNLKKGIDLRSAKSSNPSLLQSLAMQQAYHLYELYFKDRDSTHLIKANHLLEPYQLHSPFE